MTSSLRLIEADAFEAWLARCPLPASLLQEYSVARTQEGFRVNCGWFVPAERLGAVPAAPPVAATTAAPAPAVPPSPRSPPNQPNQPNQSSVTEDSEATVAKLQAAIAANSSAAAAPPKDDTVARVQEAISRAAAASPPPAAAAAAPACAASSSFAKLKEKIERAEWPKSAGDAPTAPAMSDECDPMRVVHGVHALPGEPAYRWAQSMSELVVCVRVPAGTRSRDISCVFKRTQLRVSLKASSGAPVLDVPELLGAVKIDGCLWTLVAGETLQIALEKEAHGQFWRCLRDGHTEVTLPGWWPLAV